MSTTSSDEVRRAAALAVQAALDGELQRLDELLRALSVPELRALRYACNTVLRAALRDEEGRT